MPNFVLGQDIDGENLYRGVQFVDPLAAQDVATKAYVDDAPTITASETVTAGDYVNVYQSGGLARVRKASAAAPGLACDGFVPVTILSGNSGSVQFRGRNTSVTGQTPGPIFLSPTTPGAGTSTLPTGTNQIVQIVGIAFASTAVDVNPQRPLERAAV